MYHHSTEKHGTRMYVCEEFVGLTRSCHEEVENLMEELKLSDFSDDLTGCVWRTVGRSDRPHDDFL